MTTHSKTANHSNYAGTAGQAPKLLDRLRIALEARRYRAETVCRFVDWNRQFILFHNKRHPKMMGREEIEQFLSHPALAGHGAELQAEARQALALLYREILGIALHWPEIVQLRCQSENPAAKQPKLLERVREVLRARHYSLRTEECYLMWLKRYIVFHNKRQMHAAGAEESNFRFQPRLKMVDYPETPDLRQLVITVRVRETGASELSPGHRDNACHLRAGLHAMTWSDSPWQKVPLSLG